MGRFLSALEITPVGRREFELISSLIYISDAGKEHIVEAGRRTDLASTWGVPIIATQFDGLAPMSAVLHDKAYDGVWGTRKEADDLFLEAIGAENDWYKAHGGGEAISNLERHAMYLGVQMFGQSAFRGEHTGI